MSTSSDLDPASILNDAAEQARFSDWATGDLREPLDIIVDAIDAEAQLHAAGRVAAARRLTGLLTSYASVQRDRHLFPEICDVEINPPVVVVGLPRSGTTLLHALFGADPANRAPVWWEALKPSPPPRPATYDHDPRRDEVEADLAEMLKRNPALLASLPYAADLVTECNTMMQPTLHTVAFTAAWRVPSYEQWYLQADHQFMYAYHRQVLQQLQWQMPTQQWVLKAPPHLFTCAQLVAEYPDACIVEIHRDPAKTMASGASLIAGNRILHTDDVDPHDVGREYLAFWALANDRMETYRASDKSTEVVDVLYTDLITSPVSVMRNLYDDLGLTFTPSAEQGMTRWLSDNARERRPAHRYTLQEFGLSTELIDETFGDYYERRHIPLERS
jgi:hypothetical protein